VVVSVKPGGPTAHAGIRAADFIVRHQDGSQVTVTVKLGSLPG
jgi:C-terminal processing protease CtpA/Prc